MLQVLVQPMERTVLMQAVPEQRMEDHSGSDNNAAAHGGPHVGTGGSGPWRAHTGAGFWQKLQPIESPHGSGFHGRNYGLGGPVLEQL